MSAPSARQFRVIFYAHSCYEITLEAKSGEQAIAKAQRLWETEGDERFTPYEGGTDAWDAEPQ